MDSELEKLNTLDMPVTGDTNLMMHATDCAVDIPSSPANSSAFVNDKCLSTRRLSSRCDKGSSIRRRGRWPSSPARMEDHQSWDMISQEEELEEVLRYSIG